MSQDGEIVYVSPTSSTNPAPHKGKSPAKEPQAEETSPRTTVEVKTKADLSNSEIQPETLPATSDLSKAKKPKSDAQRAKAKLNARIRTQAIKEGVVRGFGESWNSAMIRLGRHPEQMAAPIQELLTYSVTFDSEFKPNDLTVGGTLLCALKGEEVPKSHLGGDPTEMMYLHEIRVYKDMERFALEAGVEKFKFRHLELTLEKVRQYIVHYEILLGRWKTFRFSTSLDLEVSTTPSISKEAAGKPKTKKAGFKPNLPSAPQTTKPTGSSSKKKLPPSGSTPTGDSAKQETVKSQ
jgi:hypothetical protein